MKLEPKGYDVLIDINEIIKYFLRYDNPEHFKTNAGGSYNTANFEGFFQFHANELLIEVELEQMINPEVQSFEEWQANIFQRIEITFSKAEWLKIINNQNQKTLF